MAAFLYLCTFILGANYLFACNIFKTNAQSIEDEILDRAERKAIAGGEPIEIDQAPYLAQLLKMDEQICGSSILNEYWIVTAAHCVCNVGDYSIITGSSYRSKGQNRHEIAKFIVHKNYDNNIFNNDIALIKLKQPIKLNAKQKSIQILKRLPVADDQVTLAGYGRIGPNRDPSNVLLSTVVPVVSISKCKQRYHDMGDNLTENMFCAGIGEHDSCQGDSGGPAVVDGKLVGIVSLGYDCGSELLPGVYTQIVNYIDWIKKVTKLKL